MYLTAGRSGNDSVHVSSVILLHYTAKMYEGRYPAITNITCTSERVLWHYHNVTTDRRLILELPTYTTHCGILHGPLTLKGNTFIWNISNAASHPWWPESFLTLLQKTSKNSQNCINLWLQHLGLKEAVCLWSCKFFTVARIMMYRWLGRKCYNISIHSVQTPAFVGSLSFLSLCDFQKILIF
jgi:hypothetical protein